MILATAAVLIVGVFVYILFIRPQDLPAPEPESPTKYLEERKATIYENLRDLQFEYRVGKLSDADYQTTKTAIQKELAAVLAEIDRLTQKAPQKTDAAAAAPKPALKGSAARSKTAAMPKSALEPAAAGAGISCPACGAKLPVAMKFCGECGAPIPVEAR